MGWSRRETGLYTPEDFGASPSRSAAANATALQDAMNTAKALRIPADRVYDYNGPLVLPAQFSLFGDNPETSILYNAATDGSDALTFSGSGSDISTGTPKARLLLSDLGIKGNASSGDGFVANIARRVTLRNVLLASHGARGFAIGQSTGGGDVVDNILLDNVHSYAAGTIGGYIGGGSSITIGTGCEITGYGVNGLILEDCREVWVQAMNGGSASGTGDAIVVRNGGSNTGDARTLHGLHISRVHWEQIPAGKYMINLYLPNSTVLTGVTLSECGQFESGAKFANITPNVKAIDVRNNYITSNSSSAVNVQTGATGSSHGNSFPNGGAIGGSGSLAAY